MAWSEEEDAMLVDLWDGKGQTASSCASHFPGKTKNSVIGRINRLRRSGKLKISRGAGTRRDKRSPKPTKIVPQFSVELASTKFPNEPIQNSRPVSIHDHHPGMCRWPLGDPLSDDFRFCGAGASVGGSYCAGHAAIAYKPVRS